MKLYYIANARMPTEKAHGIQIAKMCEAFIEEGIEVIVVAPHRTKNPKSIQEFYQLRVDVPVVYLPAVDWYTGGRIGFLVSSLTFMISYVLFIITRKMRGENFILYTVDMDTYSSSALALFRTPFFSEMHQAKSANIAQRFLFKKVRGIIAINKIIVEEFKKTFPKSPARYLVEPNGVDREKIISNLSKKEAREKLGLPQDTPIVLYTGRFFEWKGLEIVPEAASRTPNIRWQMVGGTREGFAELVKQTLPKNIFFAGDRPHGEIPLWLAASDALLVLGTKRDVQSYRYTSPMKLFEYLVALRPIVASSTPAMREIVSDKEVIFYEPDNAENLARMAALAVSPHEDFSALTSAARERGAAYTWQARAKRIIDFIKK